MDPNTHKARVFGRVSDASEAHAEHKMNQEGLKDLEVDRLFEDLNAGMNRGALENNGIERPPWYTKEWPKEQRLRALRCGTCMRILDKSMINL